MTIEQIENATVAGNAYHDSGLMKAIHDFVTGDAPVPEKLRALTKLDRVMGVTDTNPTEADLAEYLAEFADA